MIKYLIISLLLNALTAVAQDTEPLRYAPLIKKADSLYAIKKYNASARLFSKAFSLWGGKGRINDRYNAACSWALAGIPDSAFFNLERIAARAGYSDYSTLNMEGALIPLHNDGRWKPLLQLIRANEYKKDTGLYMSLIYRIDSLIDEDQKWRSQWRWHDNHELPPGEDSLSDEMIVRKMARADSINYKSVAEIFQQFGFPGYDLVGKEGSDNYWALVQHQGRHPDFQEHVLEQMKAAVNRKNASADKYAYLLDRLNIEHGKPQVYGTQMTLNADSTAYIPAPIIDPENVNRRRREMGISASLKDYVSYYNKHYRASKK